MRGIPIERRLAVRVATSARLVGREKGPRPGPGSRLLGVRGSTYDARAFDAGDLLEKKHASETSVSAILPVGDKDHGRSALPDALNPLADAGLVDETIVLHPGTVHSRLAGGAKVYRDADLVPGFGPVRGYGDAVWRGLSAVGGDIVLLLDPSVADPEGDGSWAFWVSYYFGRP